MAEQAPATADTPSTDSGTPLAKAAERLRASSQWLLGAFAAVGAVLAAGLQIGDIGDVSFDADAARAVATFAGIAVAVIGIIIAIAAASGVITRSQMSLEWLTTHKSKDPYKDVSADAALLQGIPLDSLESELDTASKAAADRYKQLVELGDPGGDAPKEARFKTLNGLYVQDVARLRFLQGVRRDVLDLASYTRVKSAFEAARWVMAFGALLAAGGITAFAWGANAPTKPTVAPEVLPKTPSEVTVILTKAGEKKFQGRIGKKCDARSLAGIAFSVSGDTFDVVTEKTADCRVARVLVSPKLGVVVPRVSEAAEATTTTAPKKTA